MNELQEDLEDLNRRSACIFDEAKPEGFSFLLFFFFNNVLNFDIIDIIDIILGTPFFL